MDEDHKRILIQMSIRAPAKHVNANIYTLNNFLKKIDIEAWFCDYQ